MSRTTITLRVNEATATLDVDNRTSLLDLLRERLGLTGSKKGCDHGQCGACTVLLREGCRRRRRGRAMRAFTYSRAGDVAAAVAQYGPGTMYLGGGTNLVDLMRLGVAAPLNVPAPSWMRAPGECPGMYALESAMDEFAVAAGIDPIELRVRNEPAAEPESGKPFSSRHLVDCLREGAHRFGWADRDPRPAVRSAGRGCPEPEWPRPPTRRGGSCHRPPSRPRTASSWCGSPPLTSGPATQGGFVHRDLAQYHVPTFADVHDIDAMWLDEQDPHLNPMGSKGIGEIGIVGTAAAIGNTGWHATGRRIRDLPITPAKILSRSDHEYRT